MRSRRGIAPVDSPRSDLEGCRNGSKRAVSSVKMVITIVVSIAIQFGLAIAGWGGWNAFFAHPALPGAGSGYGGARRAGGPFRLIGHKLRRAGGPWQSLGTGSLQLDCAADGFLFVLYRSYWI